MMSEFNTESFIMAIKDRPSLWDLSLDKYSNRVVKKAMWEEIALIFGGNKCLTTKEKADLCTNLQKKWRHLKYSFCREKRRLCGIRSGSAADRKTPYVYYNLLSFLHKASPSTNTQASIARHDSEETEPEQDINSPTGPYQTKVVGEKRKSEDKVGKELIDILKSRAEERSKLDKEMFQDEDKLFMMSLVSDFKKIPQELKLSAKRQILSVIEIHQQGYSQNVGHSSTASVMTTSGNIQPVIYQHSSSGNCENSFRQTSTPLYSTGSASYDEDPCSPLLLCFQNKQ